MTNKNTEIETIKSTAVATKGTAVPLDLSTFEGFDISNLKPSNLILVQGKTDLKKKIKIEDGEFFADNMNFGGSIEFIFLGSKKFYDVFKGDYDEAKGKLTKDSEFQETIKFGSEKVQLIGLDHDKYPSIFRGKDGLLYFTKVTFGLLINGMPYKFAFKGRSKLYSATLIHDIIIKSMAAHKLPNPVQGVFELFSEEKQGDEGPYYTLGCSFLRSSTDDEIVSALQFVNKLDLQGEAVNEEAPY